jgi:hypothetical protein
MILKILKFKVEKVKFVICPNAMVRVNVQKLIRVILDKWPTCVFIEALK